MKFVEITFLWHLLSAFLSFQLLVDWLPSYEQANEMIMNTKVIEQLIAPNIFGKQKASTF